eukprot:2560209-Karenia_brevis.AAC.1
MAVGPQIKVGHSEYNIIWKQDACNLNPARVNKLLQLGRGTFVFDHFDASSDQHTHSTCVREFRVRWGEQGLHVMLLNALIQGRERMKRGPNFLEKANIKVKGTDSIQMGTQRRHIRGHKLE